ncbi:co-chaperone GroES [Bdellovibrio sp. BCCA]|uniref:co-chaperone GroES n=1 Tax=Bdellovibrio sp. BCCA TaxID=3136281 RepID=UPI0030F038E6
MAKKKASAKKANVKKVAKKTVSKKTPKKVTKKSAAPAKAKKAVAKKASAKKTAVKKTVTKKSAVKKAVSKKAPAKKMTAAKPAASHLMKAAVPAKKLDLSGFVTPLDDRILVQVSGAEKMTPGGLYIPDTVADTSGNLEGYVVAVGRGHMGKKGHVRPMDVQVGDRVVFSEYAGSKIKIQNEDLIILREGDVMGVVAK